MPRSILFAPKTKLQNATRRPGGCPRDRRRGSAIDDARLLQVDPQVGDISTIAPFPLVMPQLEWIRLSAAAEALAEETTLMLKKNCSTAGSHAILALPRSLRTVFRKTPPTDAQCLRTRHELRFPLDARWLALFGSEQRLARRFRRSLVASHSDGPSFFAGFPIRWPSRSAVCFASRAATGRKTIAFGRTRIYRGSAGDGLSSRRLAECGANACLAGPRHRMAGWSADASSGIVSR